MEKKHGIMMGIIGAILFGVYNMLVFLVFKDYNAVFWLSYVFEILAFALCVGGFFVSLKNVTLKVAFFGIPLISFSLYFLILETIVSF